MTGKRLSRQLSKNFEDSEIQNRISTYREAVAQLPDAQTREEMEKFFDAFPGFVEAVDESYAQLEDRANMAQRSLEVSSQELTQANTELFQLNHTFDALINSLGQGFLLFDREGLCSKVASKACESLLETGPAGKKICEVLRIPESKRKTFQEWCRLLFEERLDFEDLVALAPKRFEHSGGRIVGLEFKPVRDVRGAIEWILVVATDQTNEVRAMEEAYRNQAFARMVTCVLKDKLEFLNFVQIARKLMSETLSITEIKVFAEKELDVVKRNLHTIKGAAPSFGLLQIKDKIHEVEGRIMGQGDFSEIRSYLNAAIHDIQNQFEAILNEHKDLFAGVLSEADPIREIPLNSLVEFANRLDEISNKTHKDAFVNLFVAVPLQRSLSRFNDVISDTAKKVDKNISTIQFVGEDIRVIPEFYRDFLANLVHVFRNIADHGIESQARRVAAGKPPAGQVRVRMARTSIGRDQPGFLLEIEDDGAGIDTDKIRHKLLQSGQGKRAETASREELLATVFDSGFSLAEKVTDISGRGVGLEAVKHAVDQLGGKMAISSELGRGTKFTFELPLKNAA